MVSGQKNGTTQFQSLIHDAAYAGINGFHCFYSSFKDAGVTNHIAVCIVDDDNIVVAQTFLQSVSHLVSTHLRLQVVGCNLWRVDEAAIFARIYGFYAAIEEEGNVSILLRFSNTQLFETFVGDIFAEGIFQTLWVEGNLYVWHGCIVLGHTGVAEREEAFCSFKAVECFINQSAGDLSCTVRTEVKEDHGVVSRDAAVFIHNNRNNELIGNAVGVGICHCFYRVGFFHADAVNHGIIGFADTFPTIIAVHCVVATADGCDFAHAQSVQFSLQLFHIILTGGWRNVAAVHEAVNVNFLQTLFFCHRQQTKEMLNVAVYTAVRQQTHQMQGRIMLFAVCNCFLQFRNGRKTAFFDSFGNAGQLLIYNAACTDIGMTNFRVAHLASWQTNIHTGSLNFSVRVFCHQCVDIWGIGTVDGIADGGIIDSEAVENH